MTEKLEILLPEQMPFGIAVGMIDDFYLK